MQNARTGLEDLLTKKKDGPNRSLDANKLIQTTDELCSWIKTQFPTAHLTTVAVELTALAREASKKASSIRRANLWLRTGIFLILAGTAVAFAHQLWVHPLREILQFLDATKGVGMYAIAFLIFLVTLEVRWKRRNCLLAVYELRSVAHIIDMHELSKDPVLEGFRKQDEDGYDHKIQVYLHCCLGLLALVSKIGQLYIDHFPDPVATTAVNEFEQTANGLSMKIWSKIINLQQQNIQKVRKF